ncbi:pyruvate:ferredoxin oxidoreductase/NADPH-cytochrome P450 reductase PNO [Cryptosporidium canis]|uniref:pyruvate dehydrogenase (NADP(+)) n=1 Tax=Cryptosporidium canis TaxID=195482 RepID=A0A9D5DHV5_9CRYT|nr:pyruvate:ferredoxin oxidoreductase/NADPH-cytochrome P450 reductase PNO [Cryptosporidium canis]
MGEKEIVDGCVAACHIAYACSDAAFTYPITPSSSISEVADSWMSRGRRNIFGQVVSVVEMQSEMGSAGALHGSLSVGCSTTTFTASQGLLLMIPNMYKIAGELWPCVFHVTARALATSSLSIFGDHNDIMAARQTGWAFLGAMSVQEVMDLALVSHVSTFECSVPFVNFFDGFRTSHELQKIEMISYDTIKEIFPFEKLKEFRERALNPTHPTLRGTATSSDVYFQIAEARNKYYEATPKIVQSVMDRLAKLTGRSYHLFDYYGHPEAEFLIVIMGSGGLTVEEMIDYLMEKKNAKIGMIKVRLFRPWSVEAFIEKIPKTVKRITVLERCKESGSVGEPLCLDVSTSVMRSDLCSQNIMVLGGRYGLASKEFTPGMALAVWENMISDKPIHNFSIGVDDDVTFKSLFVKQPRLDLLTSETKQCLFWGLGSDGTVSANKNAIKIIGESTDLQVQGYFAYDAKKAGGATMSHLRFGPKPIKSAYLLQRCDYIAVHHPSYVHKFDVLENIKRGGSFVLNCPWGSLDELNHELPSKIKNQIASRDVKFYVIDAQRIAQVSNLGRRINNILMVVFFSLANIIPLDLAIKLVKEAIKKTYGKKGDAVVNSNWKAVDLTLESLIQISYDKSEWLTDDCAGDQTPVLENHTQPVAKTTVLKQNSTHELNQFVKDILVPVNALMGDKLPVSMFDPTGTVPLGTTAYEKRGIAISIPIVDMNKCTQCNYCSIVCPHAAIRPFLLDEAEFKNAPGTMQIPKAKGGQEFSSYYYRVQVAPLDCTGCELCVHACPDDALHMESLQKMEALEKPHWDYLIGLPNKAEKFDRTTVKGSQFQQPLLEFSAACEGCGETPYVKLLTQLFGERMVIANATGCSSIWGASYPSVPYTKNQKGYGPAWGNSLFEDNAEYGLGMVVGYRQRREKFRELVSDEILGVDGGGEFVEGGGLLEQERGEIVTKYENLKDYLRSWLKNMRNGQACQSLFEEISKLLEDNLVKSNNFAQILRSERLELLQRLYESRDLIPKISHWIVGGDGWAYDIGYAGLDHVLSFGEDVNIIILDTEVYSNTGGQASKSTPFGAIAKFAQSGNLRQKKDIGSIAMEYGSVYVASIALGANYSQTVKSLLEAEKYPGTSLIVAYSTCIEHGYTKYNLQQESVKLAVESGYWPLYRYNPELVKTEVVDNLTTIVSSGFTLDSKKVKVDIENFLKRENRFLQLIRSNPELASMAKDRLKAHSDKRFQKMKDMSENITVTALKNQIKKLKNQLISIQNASKTGGDLVSEGLINGGALLEQEMHVLYGTETGNSEEVAQYIQSQLVSRGYSSSSLNLDDLDVDEFLNPDKFSTVIIVTSTSGQGEFPGSSKVLYDALLEKHLEDKNNKFCAFMRYGIFGLGDSNYVFFNEAAKKWDKLLTDCGATRIGQVGMGDDQSEEKYETELMEWFPDYLQLINAPEPKNDEKSEIPKETTFKVTIMDSYRRDVLSELSGTLRDDSSDENFNTSNSPYKPIIPPNSVLLPIVENKRITNQGYDKDVRHVVFKLSGEGGAVPSLSYCLGDSLALYGQNPIDEAMKAIEMFGLNPYSLLRLSMNEDNEANSSSKVNQRYSLLFGKDITVLQLFVECLDLWGKPNRKFFQEFYRYCSCQEEKVLAKKWAQNDGKKLIEEFSSKTGTYLDMFKMFKSARPSLEQLLDIVPFIKSRSYSIASCSQFVRGESIELCIGIVDWKLESGEVRYGQFTGFLNRLPMLDPSEKVPGGGRGLEVDGITRLPSNIKASAFNLPLDHKSPIIMACMGTGIAPFRAFIQNKKYIRDVLNEEIGPVILYFGCRYYDMDYLYHQELEDYVKEGIISSLNIAFSRDPKGYKVSDNKNIKYGQKMYVQHLMLENSEEIYENLVEKCGYFYLCGTKQVPIDIRKAIIQIIIKHGSTKEKTFSEEDANNVLNEIQIMGRYNVEAWS